MSDTTHIRTQRVYDPNTLSWVAAQQAVLNAGTVTGTFFQTTQPVSGTFWQVTQPVSAVALPLPSGAATNTVLTDGTLRGTVALSAGSAVVGHVIADASSAVIGHVIVDTAPTTAVTGTFWQVTQPISGTVSANAGTNLNTSALALEAGHLATIDTSTAKIPALGQALAAASVPVVLTAAQLTTLTPPAAIAGFALDATAIAGNASLASLVTQTDAIETDLLPLVTATAGGYVRQDATQTIAKEAGGNLETTSLMLQAVVVELRLLRQAFQDWSGASPRYDENPLIVRVQ